MKAGLIKRIFVNWKRDSRMEITLPKWKLEWLKNSYVSVRIKRSCIDTLSVGYCLTSSKSEVHNLFVPQRMIFSVFESQRQNYELTFRESSNTNDLLLFN